MEQFSSYTLGELRQIESKLIAEIGSKKQEMRTVVGERYTDLIDAADSIDLMEKHCSKIQNLLNSLHSISSANLNLKQVQESLETQQEKRKQHAIASQIKLLIDSLEKIWKWIEDEEFLKAASGYLVSRLLYKTVSESEHAHKFPVIHLQWNSIQSLKQQIITNALEFLRNSQCSSSKKTSRVCLSLILLNHWSSSTTLQTFFDQSSLYDTQKLEFSDSIADYLYNLIKTTFQSLECFGTSGESINAISNVIIRPGAILELIGYDKLDPKLFPDSLLEYVPFIEYQPLETSILSKAAHEWFINYRKTINEKVPELLDGKIASVKESLDLVDQIGKIVQEKIETSEDWLNLKYSLFSDEQIHLWKSNLEDRILEQVERSISGMLHEHLKEFGTSLSALLNVQVKPIFNSVDEIVANFFMKIQQLHSSLVSYVGSNNSVIIATFYENSTKKWIEALFEILSELIQGEERFSNVFCIAAQSLNAHSVEYYFLFSMNLKQNIFMKRTNKQHSGPIFDSFKGKLEAFYSKVATRFATFVANRVISEFTDKKSVSIVAWTGNLLKTIDLILPKTGESDAGILKLPNSPSQVLSAVLRETCSEIHEFVEFCIDEQLCKSISVECGSIIADWYIQICSQNPPLQQYFDLLLLQKYFKSTKKIECMLESTLKLIDPIDFALGKSHLIRLVDLYYSSTSLMHAPFIGLKPLNLSISTDSSSILELANQPARFAPISLVSDQFIPSIKRQSINNQPEKNLNIDKRQEFDIEISLITPKFSRELSSVSDEALKFPSFTSSLLSINQPSYKANTSELFNAASNLFSNMLSAEELRRSPKRK